MIEIPLHSRKYPGMVALIDAADYELVSQYRWNPCKGANTFYAITGLFRNGKKSSIQMHSLITGFKMVDHHDHNGLNNQRYNLLDTTFRRNGANRMKSSKPSSSIYKGVSWNKRHGKWIAAIGVTNGDNYKRDYIGCFVNECDAALAYNFKADELFGDDASFNIAA